jgi:hypothetical protein
MTEESAKEFWQPSFDALYEACFFELASDHIILAWYWIDLTVSILTTITVLASALSGWVLWGIPSGKIVWGCITVTAFALTIFHRILAVPSRIRSEGERRQLFSTLRVQIQNFRETLPNSNASNASKRLEPLCQKLSSYIGETPQDMVFTLAARKAVQAAVNEKLRKFIHA